jgi:hypothetical protein
MTQAAIGLRAHSGWAASLSVGEIDGRVFVIDRRRLELADPAVPGFPQPYHAAEDLPMPKSEVLISRCLEVSRQMAVKSLAGAIEDLRNQGYEVRSCGVLVKTGKPLPVLSEILASHALLHTAEGAMFRDALCHGAARLSVAIAKLEERAVYDETCRRLRISKEALDTRLAELGKAIGPPWREDQKFATLAAWVALHEAPRNQAYRCATL